MKQEIKKNYSSVLEKFEKAIDESGRNREEIRLIAVSKTKPVSLMEAVKELGQIDFGENYIQEAMDKIDTIGREGINWHFIGGLQTKKAKYAVKYFDIIHSVDSIKLALEINKRAESINKVQDILIQINTGKEIQKSGIMPEDIREIFKEMILLENINIIGLMAIPPFDLELNETRKHFKVLRKLKEDLNAEFSLGMKELSMGMTSDFEVAIEEGATMVRVGTAIFGLRY